MPQQPDDFSLSYNFQWLGIIGLASSIETAGLYAIDTTIKRLQNSSQPVYSRNLSFSSNFSNLQRVVFADTVTQGPLACTGSLFRGLPIALGYKFLQRGALALQGPLKKKMETYWQTRSLWIDVLSGVIIGSSEACTLLPLDFLKTRAQTRLSPKASPLTFGLSSFIGFKPAVMRNVTFVASMSIATSQFQDGMLKYGIFGKPTPQQTELNEKQKHASRALGFGLATVVSSPFDVVKVRMQTQSKQQEPLLRQAPTQVAREIWASEGPSAFFKGTALKALNQSIRLTFFFGITDALMRRLLPKEAPSAPSPSQKRFR
jgi:hypothetical protein